MSDFLSRLQDEFNELVVRTQKLHDFIASDKFAGVSEVQRKYLVLQLLSMQQYKEILNFRLLDLQPNTEE